MKSLSHPLLLAMLILCLCVLGSPAYAAQPKRAQVRAAKERQTDAEKNAGAKKQKNAKAGDLESNLALLNQWGQQTAGRSYPKPCAGSPVDHRRHYRIGQGQ